MCVCVCVEARDELIVDREVNIFRSRNNGAAWGDGRWRRRFSWRSLLVCACGIEGRASAKARTTKTRKREDRMMKRVRERKETVGRWRAKEMRVSLARQGGDCRASCVLAEKEERPAVNNARGTNHQSSRKKK